MPTVAEEPPQVSEPASAPADAARARVNVTFARLQECIVSASFWAKNLGGYAASMQTLADRYAIGACLLSTVTGLTIWTTMSQSGASWTPFVTGAMAIVAAVLAIVPKTRGYGDCAAKAAPLATEYGHVLGELMDADYALTNRRPNAHDATYAAVSKFEAIKARKDVLKPYPKDLEDVRYGRKLPRG